MQYSKNTFWPKSFLPPHPLQPEVGNLILLNIFEMSFLLLFELNESIPTSTRNRAGVADVNKIITNYDD